MSVDQKLLYDIVGYLEGSCQTLENILQEYGIEYDDAPMELLKAINEQILCCEQCGWWSEASEINENGICDICAEDYEDE